MKRISRRTFKSLASRIGLLTASSVLMLGLAEIALRILGFGDPATRWDPFEGFEGTGRFFVETVVPGEGAMRVPAPNRPRLAGSFAVEKEPSSVRIFALGGSTTAGVPWGQEASFPLWTERYLRRVYPSRQIEVINVGISGLGSSRVLQVVKEVVHYDPDLLIVYTGQNEWRDAQFHAAQLTAPRAKVGTLKLLLSSRALYYAYRGVHLARQRFGGTSVRSYAVQNIERILGADFTTEAYASFDRYRVPVLDEDDAARVTAADAGGGPEALIRSALGMGAWRYLRDLAGRGKLSDEAIVSNYADNIEEMIGLSRDFGVEILFLAKASNPQWSDLMFSGLIDARHVTRGSKTDWRRHYEDVARNMSEGRWEEALRSIRAVRQCYTPESPDNVDPLLALYEGECLEKLGNYPQAAEAYERRLDTGHTAINDTLHSVAATYGAPVIDVPALVADHATNGIVGYDNFFVDRVHFTPNGYRIIGCEIASFLHQRGFIDEGASSLEPARAIDCERPTLDEGDPFAEFQNVRSLTSLGWSAFHQGNLALARERGEAILELASRPDATFRHGDLMQARLLLGYVHAREGDTERCREQWEALRDLRQDGASR